MRNIQNRIRQAISKPNINENELELIQSRIGRTSVYAGPGYYLYDLRHKTLSPTPVQSLSDSLKEAIRKMGEGDPEFFYFNAIVFKDENEMFSLIRVDNSKVGPLTLDQIHNHACDIAAQAYIDMANRARSYKNSGPVDHTIDGQARAVDPAAIRMEGKSPSKKKVLNPSKKLLKTSNQKTKK